MVGSTERWVKVSIAVALLATGCFWRSYPRQAAMHAELLSAMAHKGVDLVALGRMTAESMPELTYPLERATVFVARARARSGTAPLPSIAALQALCERYRDLLDAIDRVRRVERGEAAREQLAPALTAVEAARGAVAGALAAERS